MEVASDIAGGIVEVAERGHTDLLVISTHGVSGWHPLVFGSTAEEVSHSARAMPSFASSAQPSQTVASILPQAAPWNGGSEAATGGKAACPLYLEDRRHRAIHDPQTASETRLLPSREEQGLACTCTIE